MRFSQQNFNRHLNNIGQRVLWARNWACPCRNPQSGSADPTCPLCTGMGRIWDAPEEMVVGVASQDTQMKWAKLGQWEHGDMVVSLPEDQPAWDWGGQYDRVTTLDGLDGFSDVLVHGAPTERLRRFPKSIERVFWLNDTRTGFIEGGIPEVAANGRLTWPNGGEPPAGKQYTITGERYSEYFMLDAYPSDRNEHKGMRLPKRIVLRKFDLFGRAARNIS